MLLTQTAHDLHNVDQGSTSTRHNRAYQVRHLGTISGLTFYNPITYIINHLLTQPGDFQFTEVVCMAGDDGHGVRGNLLNRLFECRVVNRHITNANRRRRAQ